MIEWKLAYYDIYVYFSQELRVYLCLCCDCVIYQILSIDLAGNVYHTDNPNLLLLPRQRTPTIFGVHLERHTQTITH